MTDRMTTAEMQEQYEVLGFSYYLCVVRRKSDGLQGTLDFDHSPPAYTITSNQHKESHV